MRGTGNRPPFSYRTMWGCAVEKEQEPWQANLQELEPPTCGGEKRTFRNVHPRSAERRTAANSRKRCER